MEGQRMRVARGGEQDEARGASGGGGGVKGSSV